MHEFGMRVALGATRSDLLRMILGQGLKLSLAGTAAGLLAAAVLTRLMGSLLYEVNPVDPVIYAAVAVLTVSAAAFAGYLPGRRATSVDPMNSLRSE